MKSKKLKVKSKKLRVQFIALTILFIGIFSFTVFAQNFQKDFKFKADGAIEVTNIYGRIKIEAKEVAEGEEAKVWLIAQGSKALTDKDFEITASESKIKINVNQQSAKTRVDLTLQVPARVRLKLETEEGEVMIDGDVASAEVFTDTGTIATNIPLENIKYEFIWTQSRPRYLSDITIEDVKEKAAGRFEIKGTFVDKEALEKKEAKAKEESVVEPEIPANEPKKEDEQKAKKEDKKDKKKKVDTGLIALKFSTSRGIILLNVSPTEVSSDLRERPLTESAKSIIRSGDPLLSEAIRRASPKHFGDYLKTLPPRRNSPTLTDKPRVENNGTARIKQVVARVMDVNNRAIGGLEKKDFIVTEYGKEREILSVEAVTTPFNLVLLLDVSGSIDNYVNFIRKAARNFLNTMSPNDKISIVIFSEDVKQISVFTTNRNQLSESLDTFDAGGATAYYDAIAYTLVDTLKPFKGERTAVVILSDGDDNRSFLPFESLIGSIQESGALIYPLYVPSTLVAASATNSASQTIDPLRTRYMGLTSKAEEEGARLAKVSGGVYYPIRRLDDLQKAYEDIVVQLRTAYTVTFRSDTADVGDSASPRLRVRVNVAGTFVNLGAVTQVSKVVSRLRKEAFQSVKFAPVSYLVPQQSEEITGEITKINYKALLGNTLKKISAEGFDVNKSPPAFLFGELAVSRWVSPKRTRSYPYERIYNTLTSPKRATIIPIIKDEGKNGERDFLQFDTFSLMNLLDVYVILGYYVEAQRDAKEELTDQRFDNAFILSKLNELQNFKGTAAEWNLRELNQISNIAEKAKTAYLNIAKRTNVTLHDEKGIDNFVVRISKSLDEFRTLSRNKSQQAQGREFVTLQPKEALSSDTKGRVTISDKFGGKYFFTCDETKIESKTLTLMEAKHSARAKIPSASDIKDGLLKMMLYTNLKNVKIGSESVKLKVAIRLTSDKLEGKISSNDDEQKIDEFLQKNTFSKNQTGFIKKLFQEARENNFEIILEHGETGN